jgi:hypothetical protein
VIVTTGPAGDGRAEGEADRPAGPDPPAPVFSMMVVVLPVQAATVSASAAPAATAGIVLQIALMSALLQPLPHHGHAYH